VDRACECGTEPSSSIKYWEVSSGYATGGLSSSAQLQRVSSFQILCKMISNFGINGPHFSNERLNELLFTLPCSSGHAVA
jgi:hypothetical protein